MTQWYVKELKQYASFQRHLETDFTPKEKTSFENNWRELITEIHANLKEDPTSQLGIAIGKRCMEMVNGLYGDQHTEIRDVVWQKGFKGGHIKAT